MLSLLEIWQLCSICHLVDSDRFQYLGRTSVIFWGNMTFIMSFSDLRHVIGGQRFPLIDAITVLYAPPLESESAFPQSCVKWMMINTNKTKFSVWLVIALFLFTLTGRKSREPINFVYLNSVVWWIFLLETVNLSNVRSMMTLDIWYEYEREDDSSLVFKIWLIHFQFTSVTQILVVHWTRSLPLTENSRWVHVSRRISLYGCDSTRCNCSTSTP